jgi:hypothetical protein
MILLPFVEIVYRDESPERAAAGVDADVAEPA